MPDGVVASGVVRPVLRVEALDASGRAVDGGEFVFDVDWIDAGPASWRVRLAVRHRGESVAEAAVRVSTTLPSASDPWWLIPGAFYGENRPADNDRVFPRFEVGARSPGQHRAMVSDVWEFRADRAAVPAVFAWPGAGAIGVALATTETTALGRTGIGLAHDDERSEATAHLTFPFREYPITYYGDGTPRAPEREHRIWQPGERAELEFSVHVLPSDRHGYADVLRELHEVSATAHPLRPWVGIDEAADLAAEGLLRWHYDPEPGVLLEAVGFDRELTGRDGLTVDRQAMHVGWVSGIPWAVALLRHGRRTGAADEIEAARRVVDFICGDLAPSGTFWGVWYRDHGWSQSWSTVENALHSRTLAEAALFLHRALLTEPDHVLWETALRSNLDAVVARQRTDGALGSAHHAVTGAVLSWRGSAGLAWVAALAEAAAMDERYLDAAVRAGEYYAAYVEGEYLHGAPEDVDLAPTSEDGYVAVMSYVALHRATGDGRWLDLARRAADWTLTFRYAYNVVFDEHTLLGRYDFATRGADQASSSNQHLHAYGLVCTAEMHELSAALGDPYYGARADETLACFRQFVARQDGDFNAYRGMVTERFYQTSCFQPKGMLLTLSHAWSVGVLLLGCEERMDTR
jgi:hypothetical protein